MWANFSPVKHVSGGKRGDFEGRGALIWKWVKVQELVGTQQLIPEEAQDSARGWINSPSGSDWIIMGSGSEAPGGCWALDLTNA